MNQNIIFKLSDHSFIINKDEKITNIIRKTNTTVGDVANCVTGFYSGNDKLFLKTIPNEHKNANKYDIINQNLINNDFINIPNILDGIDDKKYFIPIIKGGNIKYLKKDKWFINWSKETILHYKTDKKARFQNSSYYFKYGIAVPMVSSTQITASIIENKIFDQSIVGVFPKDIKLTYYLLAFFNTKTCNKIIRTINPSANNSANYIKKIPFIEPSIDSLENINYLVKNIIDNLKISDYDFSQIDEEINNYYAKIYGF